MPWLRLSLAGPLLNRFTGTIGNWQGAARPVRLCLLARPLLNRLTGTTGKVRPGVIVDTYISSLRGLDLARLELPLL
jgi:hypothetical protein